MIRRARTRIAPRLGLAAGFACLALTGVSARAAGQGTEPARLGLGATGSVSALAGIATLRAADPSFESGLSFDLGHFAPRLRLVLDVEYLNGHLSRKDSLGVRARGRFYDLSAHVGLRWIARLGELAAPYASLGVGVHALGSSTGNPEVDELYNRNILGLHGAVGLYSPLSASGKSALSIEVRAVGAQNVRRASVRLGLTRFFRDLVVPVRLPPPE